MEFIYDFTAKKIHLNKIYESALETSENTSPDIAGSINYEGCEKINAVYGGFSFPPLPDGRAFTLGLFVQSIDGKIAFPESPDGTLVAKGNDKDPDGALADYWVLNMLRTVRDGVLMGGAMIGREPELTGRICDPDLSEWRRYYGKTKVPLHVIVTGKGRSIPPQHKILTDPDIPVLIVTTDTGIDTLKNNLGSEFSYPDRIDEFDITEIKKSVIVCGEKDSINIVELLKVLKGINLDTLLIESPTILSNLMGCGLLDELFLNTSSIFIGGKALSIGENNPAFTVEKHPSARVVSINSHSDYFFYTQYRM